MATSNDVNFSKIKNIKQEHKDLVNGLDIREQTKLFTNDNDTFQLIPPLVIHLCLLFWYNGLDRFNPKLCGDSVKISDDGLTIYGK